MLVVWVLAVIQTNDFDRFWADIRSGALAAFEHVGDSGCYVLGEEVRAFEQDLSTVWGLPAAVGVGSGLDAIEISLRALGCSAGDRVLTTPISAFATTLAIVKTGAIPVFVDTDPHGLIDLARCCELLKSRPEIRYFVPVHLYGQVLDMAELDRLRGDYDMRIVEDCAQSIGAGCRGRATGSAGQLAATSFYPTKNLGGMGDGGAILSADAGLSSRVRVLRDYGQTSKYQHDFIGYNSRLDEIQAAIIRRACLPRLERWTACRRSIANAYRNGIQNRAIRVPVPLKGSEPSWHLFPVWVIRGSVHDFRAHMREKQIAVGSHYPTAIPDQPALNSVSFEMADPCETARRLCATQVSIPIHPYLTEPEVIQVIEAVNSWPGSNTLR